MPLELAALLALDAVLLALVDDDELLVDEPPLDAPLELGIPPVLLLLAGAPPLPPAPGPYENVG